MNSFTTLIYDYWRSTRLLFAVAFSVEFAISFFSCLTFLAELSVPGKELNTFVEGVIFSLHAPYFLWILILLFTTGSDSDVKLTLPRYLNLLPLSAPKIVAARMSYGILSSLTLALPAALVFFLMFGTTEVYGWTFYYFLAVYPLVYIVLQALVWCLGPAGIPVTLSIIIAIFILPLLAVEALEVAPAYQEYMALFALVAALLLSFPVACAAIAQHRKGRFAGRASWSLRRRSDRPSSIHLSDTFASKAEALRWFQYREQSSLLPKLVLPLSILYFPFLRIDRVPPNTLGSRLTIVIYLAIFAGAILAALFILLRGWGTLIKKEGAFLFNRPATTMELISARWGRTRKQ